MKKHLICLRSAVAFGLTCVAASTATAQPYALSETFLLESNPGANHTIYLDFDGHTTSGTSWNTTYNGGQDFTTPAYDFNTSPNSFSNMELTRIQHIWQRVTEDFYPFDINVTTADPGADALTKSSTSGDTTWGARVVIGGSATDWYLDEGGAGGVAYVGSFQWASDTPAFVFEDNLANGNEKYTAEAISHEAGHTLGLLHDGGNDNAAYHQGNGSGETGWAPIMGTGYYRELTQWSKGEYEGATQTQDDLQRITSVNGIPFRADDHGDSMGDATPLTLTKGTTLKGFIGTPDDLDFFSLSHAGGAMTITVDPFERGPNLDIQAILYDATGLEIVNSNPQDAINALIDGMFAAGDYFLAIDGVGKGDPLNGDGYTDYGSLGQYTISAVPEPGTAVALLITAIFGLARRRRCDA